MKYFLIPLLAVISLQSAASEGINLAFESQQHDETAYEPQKLKTAVVLKWGGYAVAVTGGATFTVPLVAFGGLCGMVGTIAQDVQTIRWANHCAENAGEQVESIEMAESAQNSVDLDFAFVEIGSRGTYQLSQKESCPFTVIEIQNEKEKVIRIEYKDANGKLKQKLTRASNSRLTFIHRLSEG